MTTTTLGLTTMEALAQIIRKWRLIERTSKIDLSVAVPPTLVAPLDAAPGRNRYKLRTCSLHSLACILSQTIIIHNRLRVLATTYTTNFLQL